MMIMPGSEPSHHAFENDASIIQLFAIILNYQRNQPYRSQPADY